MISPRLCRLLIVALALFATPRDGIADPGWWAAVKNAQTPNDYQPLLVGQAKNMAMQAMQAMDNALAPFNLPDGGAGREIHQMVHSWRTDPTDSNSPWKKTDVGFVMNQAQLKALAKPFYDRLAQLGLWERGYPAVLPTGSSPSPYNTIPYTSSTWWNPAPTTPAEWSALPRYPWKFWVPQSQWEQTPGGTILGLMAVNVGQLKHCFNFDPVTRLAAATYSVGGTTYSLMTGSVPTDTDSDGVPDLVERLLGSNPLLNVISPSLVGRLFQDGFSSPTGGNGLPLLSDEMASRFLMQATWGSTWESIAEVKAMGIEAWITNQIQNDPFREPGQMMQYAWLDGSGTMPWQNLWYEWPDQAVNSVIPTLYPGQGDYIPLEIRWPNHQDPVWRAANDSYERGPLQSPSFPKRGLEPLMYYIQWRKLVLDRPMWQAAIQAGRVQDGWVNYEETSKPWPYWLFASVDTNLTGIAVDVGMDGAWLTRALYDSDQLRQRIAWALSQILVTSDTNLVAANAGLGSPSVAHYYDMLSFHAFGSFKEMLRAVTMHPLMANWLTYVNNTVTFDELGVEKNVPDENYAREIMQLFSTGLDELNLDGTPRLDSKGNRIPTYDQDDVRNLARVFTGLKNREHNNPTVSLPLLMDPAMHDKREKNFIGLNIPANPSATAAQCEAEVRLAVDHIATRPSVAPFISRQLIMHLVTSQPSAAYVKRVATVFQVNAGASDQLGKVIKAILMDPEARSADIALFHGGEGRLMDPMLRLVSLYRAFRVGRDYSRNAYDLRKETQHPLECPLIWDWGHNLATSSHPFKDYAQHPFLQPSVFSFFQPGFSPPGILANARQKAPEFQLLTDATVASSLGRTWNDTGFKSEGGSVALGINSFLYGANGSDRHSRLYTEDTIVPVGSTFNLKGKVPKLHFDTLPASGALPAILGTEIDMSPRPSVDPPSVNPTPPTAAQADAFLDKLDTLMCRGRMTSVTRGRLRSFLTSAADSSYMDASDSWRWERTTVQLLWALPETAVLR